ncbi:MAG: hypothetical protein J6V32_03985 [Elusimicrobiaceae bacterium]|nr:hypothetical protein [Alphaproteobacteria bacterium]MBO7191242.1 hypothetical protein [Elusimicrobiaceae bacterium]
MRYGLLFCCLLLTLPGWGQIQRSCRYGVLPTENITTIEANPALTVTDDSGGISTSSLTFKTYRVIDANLNWGVEVPLSRYESPEKSVSGLGDALFNVTWMRPESQNRLSYGAKLEFFVPTATDKRLGSGALQASPSVFAVWRLDSGVYIAGGYKQYTSVLKDGAREYINYGRFRLNISYLSPDKWWVQTNWYYYQDYYNDGKMEFIPELEWGTLVNEGTAFYINGSTHASGNWHSKDWSLGVGFKLLYL